MSLCHEMTFDSSPSVAEFAAKLGGVSSAAVSVRAGDFNKLNASSGVVGVAVPERPAGLNICTFVPDPAEFERVAAVFSSEPGGFNMRKYVADAVQFGRAAGAFSSEPGGLNKRKLGADDPAELGRAAGSVAFASDCDEKRELSNLEEGLSLDAGEDPEDVLPGLPPAFSLSMVAFRDPSVAPDNRWAQDDLAAADTGEEVGVDVADHVDFANMGPRLLIPLRPSVTARELGLEMIVGLDGEERSPPALSPC